MKLVNLFVYGTLKSNELHNSYLKGSRFISEGKTLEEFCMYNMGHYPIVTLEKVVPIQGELYRVSLDTLDSIDKFKGSGYKRIEAPIILPMSGTVKAYMYINTTEGVTGELIRDGVWS